MNKYFPYPLLERSEMIRCINEYAKTSQPFLFVTDFKGEKGYVIKKNELQQEFIKFEIESTQISVQHQPIHWQPKPISFEKYLRIFEQVVAQIKLGNSFLVNLTQPTQVDTNLTLEDIYNQGNAPYKLWIKDHFAVLSPETFIRIRNGRIHSYPMKGTIDGTIPEAASLILNDPKEKAEHATIVDLIRNDLSMIAENVTVKRYRYIDKINTHQGELLQVSSEIQGDLPQSYKDSLGNIIFALLPAGSICGAPKPKTVDIIESYEGYQREFYTGIFGWFDGENLDSAVMIRFVEQQNEQLIFKSGGGITAQSDPQKEYLELIQKVYVPLH